MTETRDAGLSPERVEALLRNQRPSLKECRRGCVCRHCIMDRGAATIAELQAELGTAIRERDEARAGHALAGQRAMEAADELERTNAALREADPDQLRHWSHVVERGSYRSPNDLSDAGDLSSWLRRMGATVRALAPVADQTGDKRAVRYEDGQPHRSHRWGGTGVPGTSDIATCICGVGIEDDEALEPCPANLSRATTEDQTGGVSENE